MSTNHNEPDAGADSNPFDRQPAHPTGRARSKMFPFAGEVSDMKLIDEAAGMAAGLAQRGYPIFEGMEFTVDGSPELANAFLRFAMSDDRSYAEFMRAGTVGEIVRLPVAVRHPGDAQRALVCVQKVQLVLYMLSEDINNVLHGKTAAQMEALRHATNQQLEAPDLPADHGTELGGLDLDFPSP